MGHFKFCRLALSTGLVLLVLTFPARPDQLPRVPSPNGFIEASTLSPFIRNMAVAGQPATSKLIGVYYPPDALAQILSAGRTDPAAFCNAKVLKEFGSVQAADDYLRELVRNAKKEGEQRFDRNDAAVDRIMKHYENAAKNIRDGVAITVNGSTVLGALAETDSYYASSAIFSYTSSEGQRNAILPFAVAMVWMRIGKQVVTLSVAYPFLGRASILAANDTALSWLKSVIAAN